jgi:hypothetical protein
MVICVTHVLEPQIMSLSRSRFEKRVSPKTARLPDIYDEMVRS